MKILSHLNHLLLIAVITILFGVIYGTVQQSYRTGANDPQIQMAEDISTKIHRGKPIDIQTDSIDIANSLSPFVVLYDALGTPVKSTGYLNGKMAQLPGGVFDAAKKEGQDWITWQPQQNVRIAMIVTYINSTPSQFVAAGRSLREVENREYDLRQMILAGWIICIGFALLHAGLQSYRNRQKIT